MDLSLAPLVMVLLVSVIAVTVCRYLKISSMQAYLIVGFIAGPGVLSLIPMTHTTEFLGEIGIVFLMFSIGLEFSLSKLKAMKRLVFGLGSLQVLLTLCCFTILLAYFHFSFLTSLALASAITMSSTAIVSRLLAERSELSDTHGQMSMGILLMQDIAVVPLMILLPALAAGDEGQLWVGLGLAFLKMVVTLVVLLVVGQKLMGPWFRVIAKTGSAELFMVNILLVILGVAYITELVGLSLVLGAFIAGMLISETQYHYQVQSDIQPFRDILLGFFFMTVGMRLEFSTVWQYGGLICILFLALLLIKGVMLYISARLMKYTRELSYKTALYLSQAGEFGFVLLAVSDHLGIIPKNVQQIMVVVILLSMMITPMLVMLNQYIEKRFKWGLSYHIGEIEKSALDELGQSHFVLIIGFGRGGQSVARILSQQDIPYYALDLDAERASTARMAGEPVQFGDAKRRDVLESIGVKEARMVLITISHMEDSRHIINNIMNIDPKMPIVARVTHEDYISDFIQLGADHVVADTQETGLMLATHALLTCGQPFYQVYSTMQGVRKNHYKDLQGLFVGQEDWYIEEAEGHQIHRYAFTLPSEAYLLGKGIADLPLEEHHLKLLSVRRRAKQFRQLPADFKFIAQDTLVLLGTIDQLVFFENWALQGEI